MQVHKSDKRTLLLDGFLFTACTSLRILIVIVFSHSFRSKMQIASVFIVVVVDGGALAQRTLSQHLWIYLEY